MTEPQFAAGSAEALDEQIRASSAALGQSFEGRWNWFWRNRRGRRVVVRLQDTPSVVEAQYRGAKAQIATVSKSLRQTRRRRLSWLWLRIVLASIGAVLRRFWWVFLILVVSTLLVAAVVYGRPYIEALLASPTASPSTFSVLGR